MAWELIGTFELSRGQKISTQIGIQPLQYFRLCNRAYSVDDCQYWGTAKLSRPSIEQEGAPAVFWQAGLYDRICEFQAPNTGIVNGGLSIYGGVGKPAAVSTVALYIFF